jgi:hypothetical protein
MSEPNTMVDGFFDAFRQAPPPLSATSTRAFIESAQRLGIRAHWKFPRLMLGTSLTVLLGSVVLIGLLISSFQPPAPRPDAAGPVRPDSPAVHGVSIQDSTTARPGTPITKSSASVRTPRRAASILPPSDTSPRSVVIPDRIEPLSVYMLDSMELANIGLFVEEDGSINNGTIFVWLSPSGWNGFVNYLPRWINGSHYYISWIGNPGGHAYYLQNKQPKRLAQWIQLSMDIPHFMVTDSHGRRWSDICDSCVLMIADSLGVPDTAWYDGRNIPSLAGKTPHGMHDRPLQPDSLHIGVRILTYDFVPGEIDDVKDLIPIRIDTRAMARYGYPAEERYLILWYPATADFLMLLPERIRENLHSLNEERSARLRPYVSVESDHSAGPQPSLMTVAQDSLFASVTLACTFDEPRAVAVALYDIDGKKVKDISREDVTRTGAWSRPIPLDGIAAGLYQVAIFTDRGERAIRRIAKYP